MHATSRSVAAAARTHPAGVAAPSAVLVTAIVLFTLVMSVIVPAIPPGLFGSGSAPVIQPDTGQPRHRVQPQPVLTGPPILPGLPAGLGRNVPGQASGGQPVSSPLPPSAAGSPPAANPAPRVSPHLPSSSLGGCPACYAAKTPTPAVTGTVAAAGSALHEVVQVVTGGSAVRSVTTTLGTVSSTAIKAVGAVTSTVTSATPVTATASAGSSAAVTAAVSPTPVAAAATGTVTAANSTVQGTVTAANSTVQGTVTAANSTMQGIAQVQGTASQGTASQGGSGQGGSGRAAAQGSSASQAAGARASSAATGSLASAGSAEGTVEQALPATRTLPGLG
jgi:hypothetical protein